MAVIDQDLTFKDIEAKLGETTNPRHRLMLERLLQHARGEVEEDLEAVLGTLAPNPRYRVWRGPPEMNPEGFDNVRRFYIEQIFGKGRHVLESVKERILVTDEAIITEGPLRSVMWGRDLIDTGTDVPDPDGAYLMEYRMLIVWPYDEQGRIIGEESWSSASKMRQVDMAETPESFRRYVARRQKAAA
jgi:hypothetical protein